MSGIRTGNLYAGLPAALPAEEFSPLLGGDGPFRLQRIVSTGQASAPGEWYDQADDEWVVLLRGAALLRFADRPEPVPLAPGDWLLIPAHRRHRVEATSPTEPTVWLALHHAPGGAQE